MNPYQYEKLLSPGTYQTVVIANTCEVNGSFVVSDCPHMFNVLNDLVNKESCSLSSFPSSPRGRSGRNKNRNPSKAIYHSHQLYQQQQQHRLLTSPFTPGTACLVLFTDNRFYRAYILRHSLKTEGEVEVYFVDYGNVWSARKNRIFEIEPSLVECPVISYLCRLADVDDSTEEKKKMIAIYIKESINIPHTFTAIEVVKEENNIHFVKLHLYSMKKYINFNDHLNHHISFTLNKAITGSRADNNHHYLTNTSPQEETSSWLSIIASLKSNFDYAIDLVNKVQGSHNILIDDDVLLINVKIVRQVSPFEFYALPIGLTDTNPYYEQLHQKVHQAVQELQGSQFELNVPSEVLAYFNETKKAWGRGRITQVVQQEEQFEEYKDHQQRYSPPQPRMVTEYYIRDYDDLSNSVIKTTNENKRILFNLISSLPKSLARLPSQALHCVLPTLDFVSANQNEEAVRRLKDRASDLLRDNEGSGPESLLYILPLCIATENDYQSPEPPQLIVNLYFRDNMLTGMFETQMCRFSSYIAALGATDTLTNNYKNSIHHLPYAFDFAAPLHRNLNAVTTKEVVTAPRICNNTTWTHYRPVVYPNVPRFTGEVTSVNETVVHFRTDYQRPIAEQVHRRLLEIGEAENEGHHFPRLKKTLLEKYALVVLDRQTGMEAFRAEVISVKAVRGSTELPTVRVALVDSGRVVDVLVEDLRDIVVLPEVPSLALSVEKKHLQFVEKGIKKELLLQPKKRIEFEWKNFPNLPMHAIVRPSLSITYAPTLTISTVTEEDCLPSPQPTLTVALLTDQRPSEDSEVSYTYSEDLLDIF